MDTGEGLERTGKYNFSIGMRHAQEKRQSYELGITVYQGKTGKIDFKTSAFTLPKVRKYETTKQVTLFFRREHSANNPEQQGVSACN